MQDWRQRLISGHGVQEALRFMVVLGVGAVMGDGVLTPAVSVVSAVEGLKLAASDISQGEVVLARGVSQQFAWCGMPQSCCR